MKKIELPNIIGSRRILRDLKKVADEKEMQAQVALRMRKHATDVLDYESWRQKAIDYHEFSEQLDAFMDQYRIL